MASVRGLVVQRHLNGQSLPNKNLKQLKCIQVNQWNYISHGILISFLRYNKLAKKPHVILNGFLGNLVLIFDCSARCCKILVNGSICICPCQPCSSSILKHSILLLKAYTVLPMHMDANHRTYSTNHIGSISHHQLLIALGVDTHTYTHTPIDIRGQEKPGARRPVFGVQLV